MKVVIGTPPNYDEIIKAFPFVAKSRGKAGIVFTYFPYIYNPDGFKIPENLYAHEVVHLDQQKTLDGARIWWEKYLTDPKFRLEQEIPAYRSQYQFFCKYVKHRNDQWMFLRGLAADLSGPMYGDLVSMSQAENLIKNKTQ